MGGVFCVFTSPVLPLSASMGFEVAGLLDMF